jgi:hypothetical protein
MFPDKLRYIYDPEAYQNILEEIKEWIEFKFKVQIII